MYRNLYIDNKTRNPKVKGLNQFVNNVLYNWGNGGAYIMGDTQQKSDADIRNNYFIVGTTDNYDGKKLGATAPLPDITSISALICPVTFMMIIRMAY